MIIACDIDGVLASFEHGYAPLLTAESGYEFPNLGKSDWPTEWYWERSVGVTKQQESAVWAKIKASSTFWKDLPAHPGANEFLSWLVTRQQDDIYFITHRMGHHSKYQTERWLKKHGFLATPTVLMTS